jgi:anti-sigma B factor antagonist
MDIKNFSQDGVTVIAITGSLDSNTSTQAQEKVLPLITQQCCLVLDLTECVYVSSAGLRVLLMIAKQLASQQGHLGLAGISNEIQDVMEMTGFSGFFQTFATVQEAAAALKGECGL